MNNFTKKELAEMAAEAGVTVEEMKRTIEVITDRREEMGEEAWREFAEHTKKLLKEAEADGVSVGVLMEAYLRRRS